VASVIPSFYDESTPPGEKEVFRLLAAGPDSWVAIHSLDLAPWNRGLRTEIDFLVVVPDVGIACIEVKSHDRIEFDGQMWRPPSIKRSPFKQALDARYTFARRLSELVPSLAKTPVVHICVFPRARFDVPANMAVQQWELIDRRTLAEAGTPLKFADLLSNNMRRAIEADVTLSTLHRPLSATQIQQLVSHCVPIQRRRPSAREEIEQRRSEVERILRIQQAPVLALCRLNARVLVTGPAGTGKTLIAMEVARRAAEGGRRVGLLCHNQLVGDWMAGQFPSPEMPNLLIGPAIRIIAKLAGIHIPPNASPQFWDKELPALLEERVTDPEFRSAATFDYLVVDEVQDLMSRPALWEAIGSYLEGSFTTGAYALFGDFVNQALGREWEGARARDHLLETATPALWELAENCRNYRVIGEAAASLAGSGPHLYSGYLRSGGSARDYDIEFYSDDREQDALLEKALRDFKTRGFRPNEISVLSFRSNDKSAAFRLRERGVPLDRPWPLTDRTSFASVHGFKGMENRVIILSDLVLSDASFERSLFYTGVTRATESVLILCHESSRATLARWLSL
jgi:hypothetical protein